MTAPAKIVDWLRSTVLRRSSSEVQTQPCTNDRIEEAQNRLGIQFAQPELLELALRHRSKGNPNNQRLEFLGDAVLGVVVAHELYSKNPDLSEGDLTLLKNSVVSNANLANVARTFDLSTCIDYDELNLKQGIDEIDSVHADAVEAIIGAVLLDGGFHRAFDLVQHLGLVDDLASSVGKSATQTSSTETINGELSTKRVLKGHLKHPKNQLQEWIVQHSDTKPKYVVTHKPDSSGSGLWKVECRVPVEPFRGVGQGKTIKQAEKQAAESVLSRIVVDPDE